MKLYEVKIGHSVITKVGTAHDGAVLHKNFFTNPEEAEKLLKELEKNGKVKFLKEIKEEKKEDKKEETKKEFENYINSNSGAERN